MSRSHPTKLLGPQFSSFVIFGLFSVITFVLASLVFPQNACAVDITLAWDANSEPDLDGYRIFYRQQGESYSYNHPDWVGGCTETTCTIYGLDDNTTYYFVARAVDEEGNESTNSNEVCYQPNIAHTQVTPDNSNAGIHSNTVIYDDDGGGFGGGCFIGTAASTLGWEEDGR